MIAGWVAGYAMAIASTLALTFLAWRAQGAPWLERMFDRELNPALLAVPIFLVASLGWTMLGLIAGALYRLAGLDDGGWPGSSFYLVIAFVGLAPLGPLTLLWPRYWSLWLLMSVAFGALFGLLMPALAAR